MDALPRNTSENNNNNNKYKCVISVDRIRSAPVREKQYIIRIVRQLIPIPLLLLDQSITHLYAYT